MEKLTLQVAESLVLPVADIQKWRRDREISIRRIPGGWQLQLSHEPAVSVITAAWQHRRERIYGKR